ncbi:MAG: hypothetical protein KBT88_10560 [Gammaproteobacteria bacterium]|nr:hypothetical protein [Gammaproteobacteria bacterium]MBQ0840216.1 hypothetical protein [Gammaproteobacteria bacterium]
MSPKLKQGVNTFYNDKQLSDKQYEQLNNLIGDAKQQQSQRESIAADKATSTFWQRKKISRLSLHGSIAAAVSCLSLVLLIAFLLMPHSANIQEVATEVASNHSHLKPLTIQSSSFPQVRAFFTELSFEIQPSSLLNKQRWQLLGGRYCSVNGIKAAQLRLLDTKNKSIQTFYQVENKAAYFEHMPNIINNELPVSVNIDGVPVTVWSENGILYALTHSPSLAASRQDE